MQTFRLKANSRQAGTSSLTPNRTESRKRFMRSLDPEVQSQILFSGYSRAQFLELDLESIGLDKNVEAFFENCSDKEYYRFFAPLCPRHPFPYTNSLLPLWPGLSSLIHIDVGLLALENLIEGENTLRAGLKICAKWQPAQQEIRKAKYHSSDTDGQDRKFSPFSYLNGYLRVIST